MADKLGELVQNFYLDVVGAIIPGILVLGGWVALTGGAWPGQGTFPDITHLNWWVLLPISYAVGQVLAAVGETFLMKPARKIFGTPEDYEKRSTVIYLRKHVAALADIASPAGAHPSRALRSVAMTLIAASDLSTTRRFSAIALFYLEIATGTLLLAIGNAVWQLTVVGIPAGPRLVLISTAAAVIFLVSLARWEAFDARSQRAPYDMLAGLVIAKSL